MPDLPKQMERQLLDIEMHILKEIIRRISMGKEITSTTDYLIWRYSQINGFTQETKEYIRQQLGYTQQQIQELFDETVKEEYIRNREIYTSTEEQPSYENNPVVQQYIEAVKEQTNDEIRNITQTTCCEKTINGKTITSPIAATLQDALDRTVGDIAQGGSNYTTALKEVCKELSESGIKTVDYASGRKSSIVTAVRRATFTGLGQVAGRISLENAKALNTEYFEISWHATARPSHFVWQGRVFSREELVSVCGYGTAGGLLGCNCYHLMYPFVLGVSKRSYTDEWLDEQLRLSKETKEHNGKQYTPYQATQHMRKLEARMRKQRQYASMLKEGGAKPEDVTEARIQYQNISKEYSKFAKDMGLREERERVTMDGLGRV